MVWLDLWPFYFSRDLHTFPQRLRQFTLPRTGHKGPLFSCTCCLWSVTTATPAGVRRCLTGCGLHFWQLVMPSVCSRTWLAVCASSLESCLLRSSAWRIGLFVLPLSYVSSLYIRDTNPLQTRDLQAFSPMSQAPFHLADGPLRWTEAFGLTWSCVFIFAFGAFAFGIKAKKLPPRLVTVFLGGLWF